MNKTQGRHFCLCPDQVLENTKLQAMAGHVMIRLNEPHLRSAFQLTNLLRPNSGYECTPVVYGYVGALSDQLLPV